MGYIDENLMTGESVVARTRLHAIVFAGPAVAAVVGLWAMGSGPGGALIGSTFLMIGLIALGSNAINRASSEFAVTNRRVLMKTGWIRRRSVETLLQKIEAIAVDQGVLGRLLGYGTIVVGGTGGNRERFDRIMDPMGFRRHVQEQIDRRAA